MDLGEEAPPIFFSFLHLERRKEDSSPSPVFHAIVAPLQVLEGENLFLLMGVSVTVALIDKII